MKKLITICLLISTFIINAQTKNPDNRELLDSILVSPKFAIFIKSFLDKAEKEGFKPFVKEVFRSQKDAKELAETNKKLGIATAKISMHSFGLAVDIWLKNEKGEIFSYNEEEYKKDPQNRFSYEKWMKFIKIGETLGLINAEKHSDTDHWEYHPNWKKVDWVSARKFALPIYRKNSKLKSEREKLEKIWMSAGLE